MTQTPILTAYLAPEDFENELEAELAGETLVARHGRIFVVSGPPRQPAWAQDVWQNAEYIKISSIGEAAKELRRRHNWWACESFHLHRRAALITEKLPRVKKNEIRFLSPLPKQQWGAWTLIANDEILASTTTSSRFPLGEMHFIENKTEAPSRAYLKLWELFTVHGVRPQPGETCLDLGASPGGWTWVLAGLGANVKAYDRSELAPHLMQMKNVVFEKRNAFALKPKEIGPVDWLFSDVICYPEQLFKLVDEWLKSDLCANFVCTIKFKGETDHITARKFASIPGSRLQHLFHNKHELTWWLVRS
jgi:23S rRNA (cytidine2498-2'-O)-methyltransferase